MMRKECLNCAKHTYTEDNADEVFCVYCGEDLSGQPFLPLGNFKIDKYISSENQIAKHVSIR